MQARLLPIESVFNRFPRMVRDLARQDGKAIAFVLEGGETGLDRSVIDEIGDPLLHLLRNAVDHGVETPAERLAAGKPAEARAVLSARQAENRIIISVEDDGRGVEPQRMRDAAVRKRLLTAGAASCYIAAVRSGSAELGLIVDGLIGEQEVVIKPMTGMVGRTAGVAGTTILGDRRVSIIVDVPKVVEWLARGAVGGAHAARAARCGRDSVMSELPSAVLPLSPQETARLHVLCDAAVENISHGLTEMFGATMRVTALNVRSVPLSQAGNLLGDPELEVIGIYLAAQGAFSAHLLLLLELPVARQLCDILLEQPPDATQALSDLDLSALAEMGNIAGSFFLNSLAENLDRRIMVTPPEVLHDMAGAAIATVLLDVAAATDAAIVIDAGIEHEGRRLPAWFLTFPQPDDLQELLRTPAEGAR